MKNYYTTGAPDSSTLKRFDTMDDAVEQASNEVRSGENIRCGGKTKRRYVVRIVAIVEEDRTPVKVTYTDEAPL